MKARSLPLDLLIEAPWNPNRVPRSLMARLRRSLEEFGVVENLVARPHPNEPGKFELLSGNHRLRLLRDLGHAAVPVVVVELDDGQARLLAQTLNRTRGSDDPARYAALVEELLRQFDPATVTSFLPETEATLEQLLHGFRPDGDEVALRRGSASPRSRVGELYELGPHRLVCGDATNPEHVALALGGLEPALMVTDPPYGVGVDHSWRDGVRQPHGSARSATLLNDDRADWRAAYALVNVAVVYVWHSALHAGVVADGLAACGFELRQQIVWVKQVHALSRAHYQWRHECAWYAVRSGCSARWQGGRTQTTVWEAASPIAGFSSGEADDASTAHPTQKPLELYRRPILNHTRPGELVYDPFAGSGTCLVAAEQAGRRCAAIELDPCWCDVIRDRYLALTCAEGR